MKKSFEEVLITKEIITHLQLIHNTINSPFSIERRIIGENLINL
jgi:hypothetical protein